MQTHLVAAPEGESVAARNLADAVQRTEDGRQGEAQPVNVGRAAVETVNVAPDYTSIQDMWKLVRGYDKIPLCLIEEYSL